MSNPRKELDPELFPQKQEFINLPDPIITEKSQKLIKQGKVGQRFVVNNYIDADPTTGEIRQYQHWWPTVVEKSENETKMEKSIRLKQEKLIKEAKYDVATEVIKGPSAGMTGIVHSRGHELDLKTYDSSKYPYLKKTNNRFGGSGTKYQDNNMIFGGRSTLNYLCPLNEAFQYAYFFASQNNFKSTEHWPTGIILARALDWQIISQWILGFTKIKPKLQENKETETPDNSLIDPILIPSIGKNLPELTDPEIITSLEDLDAESKKMNNAERQHFLQAIIFSLENYSLIYSQEVAEWKNLFKLSEEERCKKLASLYMHTIYIASGLIGKSSPDAAIISTTLKVAAEHGIELKIDSRPKDIEEANEGATALMQAAFKGKNDVVEILIQAGASMNATDNDEYSALDYAIIGNQISTFKLLMEKKLSTPDDKEINSLQTTGLFANTAIKYKNTPLHMAVQENNIEIVKLLLTEYKVNPNSKNAYFANPLHFSVLTNSSLEIIETLLANNASLTEKDRYELTPVDFAIEGNKIPIIKLFLPKMTQEHLNEIFKRENLDLTIKNLVAQQIETNNKRLQS